MGNQGTRVHDSVVMGDVTTNFNHSTINDSRVTCPQCQASGNLTIFVCSSAHCNSKYCEHCKVEEYPRLCASCIHVQRKNEFEKQQEFNRTVLKIMRESEEEKKRKQQQLEREMESRCLEIEKNLAIRVENQEKSAYYLRTKAQSWGIFLLSFSGFYVAYGLDLTASLWDYLGLFGVMLLIAGIVYLSLAYALSFFDKSTSLHRNLYRTTALISPIIGLLVSLNWEENLGDIGCIIGFLTIVFFGALFNG